MILEHIGQISHTQHFAHPYSSPLFSPTGFIAYTQQPGREQRSRQWGVTQKPAAATAAAGPQRPRSAVVITTVPNTIVVNTIY